MMDLNFLSLSLGIASGLYIYEQLKGKHWIPVVLVWWGVSLPVILCDHLLDYLFQRLRQ